MRVSGSVTDLYKVEDSDESGVQKKEGQKFGEIRDEIAHASHDGTQKVAFSGFQASPTQMSEMISWQFSEIGNAEHAEQFQQLKKMQSKDATVEATELSFKEMVLKYGAELDTAQRIVDETIPLKDDESLQYQLFRKINTL